MAYLEHLHSQGKAVAVIDEKPELFGDLQDIWEAFGMLDPSRQNGMGMGYIPLAEIKAYLEMFGTDDVDRFVRLLRHLDKAYVDAIRKQEAKK